MPTGRRVAAAGDRLLPLLPLLITATMMMERKDERMAIDDGRVLYNCGIMTDNGDND